MKIYLEILARLVGVHNTCVHVTKTTCKSKYVLISSHIKDVI